MSLTANLHNYQNPSTSPIPFPHNLPLLLFLQKNMLPLLQTPTTDSGNNPRINQHPTTTTSFHHPTTTPFSDDFDFDFDIDSSTCSTPFVSAPSSPGRNNAPPFPLAGFYYSAPTSPMHFILTKNSSVPESSPVSSTCSFEFDFSARLSTNGIASAGSMSSADELFLNGQIRPMKLSTHLQRPQILAPLLDLDESEEQQQEEQIDYESERGRASKYRDKSLRRRTRSMSPLRAFSSFDYEEKTKLHIKGKVQEQEQQEDSESIETTTNPSSSGASSRSSSTGRSSSKRWVFLKEFLNRSKSEGGSKSSNNKFWGSSIKEKIKTEKLFSIKNPSNSSSSSSSKKSAVNGKPILVNGLGIGKRRAAAAPSAHELHYTARRAETEEMKKKTFLPYRQGLLGCLGFSSKSYGTMHGFARAFNSVSSR